VRKEVSFDGGSCTGGRHRYVIGAVETEEGLETLTVCREGSYAALRTDGKAVIEAECMDEVLARAV
jgi:hypothetical protein